MYFRARRRSASGPAISMVPTKNLLQQYLFAVYKDLHKHSTHGYYLVLYGIIIHISYHFISHHIISLHVITKIRIICPISIFWGHDPSSTRRQLCSCSSREAPETRAILCLVFPPRPKMNAESISLDQVVEYQWLFWHLSRILVIYILYYHYYYYNFERRYGHKCSYHIISSHHHSLHKTWPPPATKAPTTAWSPPCARDRGGLLCQQLLEDRWPQTRQRSDRF